MVAVDDRVRDWDDMVKFLLAVLALAAVGNFLYNSTPPTGEDELVYHISLPAQWLHAGHLTFPRSNPNAFFPLNGEFITTVMLGVGGWRLAKIFVWLSGLLMAGSLYRFGRAHSGLSVEGALWATAILYTMPCITSLNGTTSVDQLNILFEILCVDCLLDWNIGMAGILAGLSLGTRPYSLAWVLAAVPVFCYNPQEWVTFLGVAAVLALPYPIHNWWLLLVVRSTPGLSGRERRKTSISGLRKRPEIGWRTSVYRVGCPAARRSGGLALYRF